MGYPYFSIDRISYVICVCSEGAVQTCSTDMQYRHAEVSTCHNGVVLHVSSNSSYITSTHPCTSPCTHPCSRPYSFDWHVVQYRMIAYLRHVIQYSVTLPATRLVECRGIRSIAEYTQTQFKESRGPKWPTPK